MRNASIDSPTPAAPDRFTAGLSNTALQSLDAQAALLPYALVFFGVALPIFAWACSFAVDRVWMTASFAIFAINWAMFYAVIDWFKRYPDQLANVDRRTRIHILGGLLWAGALAQITAIALGAGPAREPLLMLATGGAAACIFFSAPNLAALLIIAPAAAAAPILALQADASSQTLGRLAIGGIALVAALSLILNRLLRRTFALANDHDALIAARARSLDEAEQLARTKSDLIATLSREIRTGLTGIADTLSAAGLAGRSAPTREQLAAALGSAQELISVLNATLDTVSAESGALEISDSPIDIAALAREAVQVARPLAAAKGLELALHVGDDLAGAVIADAGRTRQVLANLIGNAIKYTVRGRIEVRIEPPADGRIRLEVADTGPGLTPDELNQAFLPFQRIARTGAGVPGAGLGLSLSRRLASLMKGELTAESAMGVGSCFRLDLPFDAGARLEQPALATEAAAMAPRAGRALRVLIAEDDPLNAAMLRSALEQLGHHVLHAQDGRRAVDLAQVCDVDLFMLDGQMPELEGPAVARALRVLPGASGKAPIVAVIGGDPGEAEAFTAVGVDQALRKPVNVAGVARAIAAALHEEAPRLKAVS